ncbi:hypothetical protein CSOJ01_14331 [Colletotrichum sojae]|uniref:Uncharacterized protein n=1 Tax=Colletotrichum sojae TaxID=2175907 RepID=A0A8H6MK89_9PEZI|nr:hypothetical protein CSOJ01_14331 [Colletotrichum sojae]
MAPRRGGGGGGGSRISAPSCPGAFSYTTDIIFFAGDVAFFVLFFAVFITGLRMRKRARSGKKLIGFPYFLSIFCLVVAFCFSWISRLLQECQVGSHDGVYYWQIAIDIFSGVGNWLLLFVVVWTLNKILREHLGYHSTVSTIIFMALLVFMGLLTAARIVLGSYNSWAYTIISPDSYTSMLWEAAEKLCIVYWVFYLSSTIVSLSFSLSAIASMKSKHLDGAVSHSYFDGDAKTDLLQRLLGWVIGLLITMVLWIIFVIVSVASDLTGFIDSWITAVVVSYVGNLLQTFTFVVLFIIAKKADWSHDAHDDQDTPSYLAAQPNVAYTPGAAQFQPYVSVPQPQYTNFHAAPQPQLYDYSQKSVYTYDACVHNGLPHAR